MEQSCNRFGSRVPRGPAWATFAPRIGTGKASLGTAGDEQDARPQTEPEKSLIRREQRATTGDPMVALIPCTKSVLQSHSTVTATANADCTADCITKR
jgi:hypothetical protein